MNDGASLDEVLDAAGVSVRLERGLRVASLRYFDAAGPFATHLQVLFGGALPAPLKVVTRPVGAAGPCTTGAGTPGTSVTGTDAPGTRNVVLAWRSPTEILLLGGSPGYFAALQSAAADRSDGCLVEQTGGISVLTVRGARTADLLLRLGSTAAVPPLGAAHTSRVAELTVMALGARPGEVMLLVERVYAGHLTEWIRQTIADF
jgi:hypothetical protein